MKKKILVTGSGGMVLSYFIRKILYNSNNYSIVSIDRVNKSSILYNIYTNKNHSFFIGNVNDKHLLDVIFKSESPDIVIHGAAETDNAHEDTMIQNNILGTKSMLDISIKNNIEKFIYLSSYKVNPEPKSIYAITKLSSELFVKESGLNYTILRLSNVFGPRQLPNKLVSRSIGNILNDKCSDICGDGTRSRDWIHASDVSDAITLALSMKDSDTFDVCSGNELYEIEMYQKIANLLEKGHNNVNFVPTESMSSYSASFDKLRSVGWNPSLKFKEQLEETVQWYVNNQWFLRGFNNG